MPVRQIVKWIALFGWMGLIFTLSSLPAISTSDNGTYDYVLKKVAHICVYGMLFFLTWQVINKKTWRNIFVAILFCVVYAVTDEIHQSFVPGRHPHIKDVGYDLIGILLSLVWLRYVQPKIIHKLFA